MSVVQLNIVNVGQQKKGTRYLTLNITDIRRDSSWRLLLSPVFTHGAGLQFGLKNWKENI